MHFQPSTRPKEAISHVDTLLNHTPRDNEWQSWVSQELVQLRLFIAEGQERLSRAIDTETEQHIADLTSKLSMALQTLEQAYNSSFKRPMAAADALSQSLPSASPTISMQTSKSTLRSFDLNIEEMLENWEVEHALREIISNALDEQLLSQSREIEISKDLENRWHIRDFGRGLRIEHFTLNENKEKRFAAAGIIGKFGVGLKDALATFHRRGIDVVIRSSSGTFKLKQEQKHGFDEIVTLHVEYDDTPLHIQGTDFVLGGVSESDMAKAKSLFLKFSSDEVLETNAYGQILAKRGGLGRVYILGVLAADEPNFLFSYNITNLTEAMKKKLNRERLNVGRTTYTDRIKTILKSAKSSRVERSLIDQVGKRATGEQCDEMSWIEISQLALNLLHQAEKVVYVTEQEIQRYGDMLDSARQDAYSVVVVSEQQKARMESQVESGGPSLNTLENYVQEYNQSFEYSFVEISDLTSTERKVYQTTPQILALIGLTVEQVPPIKISETMRVGDDDTLGVWDNHIGAVVIKRSKLQSLTEYAATLLHEIAHATTGTVDASRAFEFILTHYLGKTSTQALVTQAQSTQTLPSSPTTYEVAPSKRPSLLKRLFGN